MFFQCLSSVYKHLNCTFISTLYSLFNNSFIFFIAEINTYTVAVMKTCLHDRFIQTCIKEDISVRSSKNIMN